jgi:hypothetical protein
MKIFIVIRAQQAVLLNYEVVKSTKIVNEEFGRYLPRVTEEENGNLLNMSQRVLT